MTQAHRPTRRRMMIIATFADDWSAKEVAQAFGISVDHVKTILAGARAFYSRQGHRVGTRIELAAHLRALGYERIGV